MRKNGKRKLPIRWKVLIIGLSVMLCVFVVNGVCSYSIFIKNAKFVELEGENGAYKIIVPINWLVTEKNGFYYFSDLPIDDENSVLYMV